MKPHILFFNAKDTSQWHNWNGDNQGVDKYIVGTLDGGYITENCIDDELRIHGRYDTPEEAAAAFIELCKKDSEDSNAI